MGKDSKPRNWRKGSVVVLPKSMLESPAYRSLSCDARCLLVELQMVYHPYEQLAVHYSTRRVQKALRCGSAKASRLFHELRAAGFIRVDKESNFIERTAREYILTWMPYKGRLPFDDWKN